jgi:hypothetical protein
MPLAADHHRLIPLVEVSLAIMRLSCERFFSLLAVSAVQLLLQTWLCLVLAQRERRHRKQMMKPGMQEGACSRAEYRLVLHGLSALPSSCHPAI